MMVCVAPLCRLVFINTPPALCSILLVIFSCFNAKSVHAIVPAFLHASAAGWETKTINKHYSVVCLSSNHPFIQQASAGGWTTPLPPTLPTTRVISTVVDPTSASLFIIAGKCGWLDNAAAAYIADNLTQLRQISIVSYRRIVELRDATGAPAPEAQSSSPLRDAGALINANRACCRVLHSLFYPSVPMQLMCVHPFNKANLDKCAGVASPSNRLNRLLSPRTQACARWPLFKLWQLTENIYPILLVIEFLHYQFSPIYLQACARWRACRGWHLSSCGSSPASQALG